MRVIWSIALTACVSLLLSTGVGLAADDTDLIEFVKVADAQRFGFAALPGAVLTTAIQGRIGNYALRVDPDPEPKEYMGVGLRREFDLAGADPKDKLVFFVKQNFGNDLCINVTTAKGNVYRYVPVTPDQWSRVEVDLDVANWHHDNGPPVSFWAGVDYLHIYSKGFDKAGEYMLMDGFSISVDGKAARTLFEKWEFPWQTESAWYVGNAKVAWAISKTTGHVLGGWNVQTRERYLNSLEGRYHLEDRKSLVTGRESEDKVLRAEYFDKEQRVELTCSNLTVPDLTIRKRYLINGNKLFQRVAFRTASKDLQFITYNSQAAFAPAYRNGGYYMGGADGGGPLIPAPHITEWQKVTQYQNTAKNMLLHQPEKGYSFAHTRTKLDDQFVWPYFTGAVASYVEAVNMMSYTPDGWDMSLGTSRLSTQRETSYEQYVSIFEGDWQRHIRTEYPALPEVQQALKQIPPVPDWVGDIKIEADANLSRLRQMVRMTDEGTIMVLVNMSGSWADYYVDRGMEEGFGGWITGPELRDHIQKIKAISPRIKVGIYMWTLSTCAHSRIYRAHPEWFRYGNKDGEPLSTFPGLAPNFAQLLSIPECYKEILSQFDLVLSYLGTDFIYLDDPKAINMIEWKSGEYTRDDMSFRFFLDVKRIAAKHGPDKMVFFNNQCNPYGDVNFIEARDQLRANFWRRFAGIAAVDQEFVTSTRPKGRINLLYFIPPLRREYMNRILALGWIPSLEYCDVIASRPFFQAAYEVGNCAPVPARYSPDWKRDKETNLESYTVQRDGDKGYLLSFINHAETKEAVPLHLDLDSLNLDRKGRVFVWEYEVENALEYEGIATESLARKVYAQTGWQLDRVTRRRLLYAGPYQKQMALELNMEPLLLHQLYVTTLPIAVYSENSLPENYLFAGMPKVKLHAKSDWKKGTIEVQVDSSRDQAEIIAFLPLATHRLERALLDGRPCESDWVWEGDDIFPLIKVGKGRHALSLRFGSAIEPNTARVEGFSIAESATGVSVNLPGFDRALLTVDKNNCVMFSRVVSRKSGVLSLPISPARPGSGAYTVSLRAVVAGNGRVQPVQNVSASLDLPAAKPDLGLGPERSPMEPGTREIKAVNRTIKGLEILTSAIVTTSETPNEIQPGLKMLTAKVEPDDLILEAGTTRAVLQGQDGLLGAAFAGLEIKNLRKVQVKLTNTFFNAFHLRGPG
ncbi:MAG: hypothetical protein HY318_11390, partial [Armatimonadetes bacterium]|nr:hypothetical protein [Armatimonadota bacterium]